MMKASELIEQIQTGKIKSGAVINCIHTGSLKYEHKIYFNGNWFSEVPYSYERSTPRYDDIILHLCNSDVVYEVVDNEESKPVTKETIEALGYACGEIRKCFEKGFNKSLNNEPLEDDDKDIPLIPDDELFLMKQNGADIRGFDYLDYNFKVLKEKINQVVKEFNDYRKEVEDARR